MNDFDNKQICLYKDIDRLGFTCDVCGRKVNGCRYINGMSFCEKCYQETFGKDNQQNEIQQLKQQLEEKDNYHLRYELAGADETITNLKKQIEEKDKELAYMTKQAKKFNNEAQKYYEDAYCNSFQNQKAIAELEKVKELVKDKSAWSSPFGLLKIQESDVEQIIDQQIKELKGEK